ncbi:hypothetical protein HFO51_06340 [Rhizobium leguminosarum]|uniref:hypothetical protein n=1 Tax=Rhizobium leguminosarum TaxID=384 RepID=UPI001C93B385|nr:hypothetical protein [Rhizobium leguminosarum]MBY5594086.1 hypothetical protein [Rhizobium leguminosarum]
MLWLIKTPLKLLWYLFAVLVHFIDAVRQTYQRFSIKQASGGLLSVRNRHRIFTKVDDSKGVIVASSTQTRTFAQSDPIALGQLGATPFQKGISWHRYLHYSSSNVLYCHSGNIPTIVIALANHDVQAKLGDKDTNGVPFTPAEIERATRSFREWKMIWQVHVDNIGYAKRRQPLLFPRISPLAPLSEQPPMKDVTPHRYLSFD